MFKILIDTCVWQDLAKDYQQQTILAALEELIRQGDIALATMARRIAALLGLHGELDAN